MKRWPSASRKCQKGQKMAAPAHKGGGAHLKNNKRPSRPRHRSGRKDGVSHRTQNSDVVRDSSPHKGTSNAVRRTPVGHGAIPP